MARFSLSFLAVFLVLAVIAMSLPTKRDTQAPGDALGLESTLGELGSVTKLMDGLENKDANDEKKQATPAPPAAPAPNDLTKSNTIVDTQDKHASAEPTRTEQKLSSGNFATPTATHTTHPTSEANGLGKIPVVGGLLGGTGAL
ncbi:hypothetical protein N7495_000604 [Penicillium taxi]|uniref:uncharacterized protein n=1 Tax=Penicillium taxi TaxID=168475 RepID=UPI002544D615|nr:uncharacterized protein N7495_000604 [Penicillium taxi]KAJ5907922.1 hypothetical protein N7495_000604 [Penicillium taxi]